MTLDERLSALEGTVSRFQAITTANERLITSALRRTAERDAIRELAALEARLDPGALVSTANLRSGGAPDPEMGSPLMDRLKADAGFAQSVAGATQSALVPGNLLPDSTFEAVSTEPRVVTPAWTAFGGESWQIRYVLQSGIAPSSVIVSQALRRWSNRLWSSAALEVWAEWTAAGAGVIDIELRMTGSVLPTYVAWPSIVATVRAAPRDVSGMLVADVVQEVWMVDENGTDILMDASDPVGLGDIWAINGEAAPAAVTDVDFAAGGPFAPAGLDIRYFWQLRLSLEKDPAEDLSTLRTYLAQPQLTYTDQETPSIYTPAVGAWNPIPYLIGARATKDNDQIISDSTYEAIAFNGLTIDTGTLWNGSTRFRAPVRGIYEALGQTGWDPDSTNTRVLRIRQYNAAGTGLITRARRRIRAANVGATLMDIHSWFPMDVGDYVQFEAWQDTGSNLALQASEDEIAGSLRLIAWWP